MSRERRRQTRARYFLNAALSSCLALVLISTGCRKKAGQGTISQPPIVVSSPQTTVPVPDAPEAPSTGTRLPETHPVSSTPWSEADERYRVLDLKVACSLYRDLWRAGQPPLPWHVAAQAVMSCSVGSPEDQRLARRWLQLLIPEEAVLDEQELALHILGQLLEQLQHQVQTVADRDAKLEQLNKELENLKKIDARRRRP